MGGGRHKRNPANPGVASKGHHPRGHCPDKTTGQDADPLKPLLCPIPSKAVGEQIARVVGEKQRKLRMCSQN
jgi:hypothetical protein